MPWPPFTGREPASHCPQPNSKTDQKLFAGGRPGHGGIRPKTREAVGRAKPVRATSAKKP